MSTSYFPATPLDYDAVIAELPQGFTVLPVDADSTTFKKDKNHLMVYRTPEGARFVRFGTNDVDEMVQDLADFHQTIIVDDLKLETFTPLKVRSR